jgi:hypothetical protein
MIYKLKDGNVPATHNYGSNQIDFGYLSLAATEFLFRCGVLDFNFLFYRDHRPLFLEIDILRVLGYPVQCTIKFLERELKLNDPRLVEIYQSSLYQQLLNHNVAARFETLRIVNATG